MDLISLFVGFSNSFFGLGPFWFIVFLYFLIEGILYLHNPLVLAFIVLFVSGLILAKPGVLFLFQIWMFELTVLLALLWFFFKDPKKNSAWFWLVLGLIAFTWFGG